MITLPAIWAALGAAALLSLVVFSVLHHRNRVRYNDKLETAFNRARYTRECGGRS